MEYSGWVEPGGYDEVVFRGDRAAREFIAFWVRHGQGEGSGGRGTVLAALNGNVWDVVGDLQQLIRSRAAVSVVIVDVMRPAPHARPAGWQVHSPS